MHIRLLSKLEVLFPLEIFLSVRCVPPLNAKEPTLINAVQSLLHCIIPVEYAGCEGVGLDSGVRWPSVSSLSRT